MRRMTEDMQSIADRHLAEVAEMRIEAGERLVHRHAGIDAAGGSEAARLCAFKNVLRHQLRTSGVEHLG